MGKADVRRFVSPSGTIQVAQVGGLTLSLMRGNPLDDEWQQMLDWTEQSPTPPTGTLALSINADISTKQRKLAADLVLKQGVLKRVAVLTDSALIRGLLTAFSWLVRQTKYKSFPPRDTEPAFAWLAEEIAFDLDTARSTYAILLKAVQEPRSAAG